MPKLILPRPGLTDDESVRVLHTHSWSFIWMSRAVGLQAFCRIVRLLVCICGADVGLACGLPTGRIRYAPACMALRVRGMCQAVAAGLSLDFDMNNRLVPVAMPRCLFALHFFCCILSHTKINRFHQNHPLQCSSVACFHCTKISSNLYRHDSNAP